MQNKITKQDIEKILNMKVPQFVETRLDDTPLLYENLTEKEFNDYVIHVIKVLLSDITKSGKHRIDEWENGWSENLTEFIKNKNYDSLIPKYHGKNRFVRWNGKIINPITKNFDYKIHIAFVDTIINNYISKNIKNVYEFGCGPGYHLLRLQQENLNLNLTGLDWAEASQKTIEQINRAFNYKINSHKFDFFNPDKNFKIKNSSIVYTVAALEQVGDRYKNFIEYLLDQNPDICVHMEPISELLDDNNLIDFLSIEYFKKRNYLSNFLVYLQELESKGIIEIIDKRRIYSGSYFIEGHSLIVWRKK